MALKDKLMTLEDFKAVRDVDVASNTAQFTAIKADLHDDRLQLVSAAEMSKTPITWLAGAISSTDGQPVSNNKSIYNPHYYIVSPDALIKFTGSQTERYAIANYYKADKSYISRSMVIPYAIPSNACFVRFSYTFTAASSQTVEGYGGVATMAADWSISWTSANKIAGQQYTDGKFADYKQGEWITGGYHIVDNAPVYNADRTTVQCLKFKVAQGEKYYVKSHASSTYPVWMIVDASGNIIRQSSEVDIDATVTVESGESNLYVNGLITYNNVVYHLHSDSALSELREDMIHVKEYVTDAESGNLCPYPSSDAQSGETTISGVTFTKKTDNSYYISGTNTSGSSAKFKLYRNPYALPDGFVAGKKYYANYYCDLFGCQLQVLAYTTEWNTIFDSRIPGYFTIPDNAIGMIIHFAVSAGVTVDTTVRPMIISVDSAQYAYWHREKATKPMLSIIYDDGFSDFKTYIMPIVESKNVPIATAVMPEVIEQSGYSYLMTWQDIQDCYANGAEVLTHFGAYPESDWNTFGTQAISRRYLMCRNQIIAHGMYTPNALVFSGSSSRYSVSRKAAMRIFDAGFNASNGGINYYGKFDPYFINRYGADNKTLNELKAYVDELVTANNGWMIWTRHNGSDFVYGQDAAYAAGILADAIDYALAQGVQIVTVERGLNEYLVN